MAGRFMVESTVKEKGGCAAEVKVEAVEVGAAAA
ncbi:hypothetical protein COLO4_35646 [Corchorus olitorius]|uniref:Uncharacterized protein n=1 Tax=Corchorus olitorius TaxID=93759 RepID=A0A1R3GE99_9ROSI|nr:hypothetical protein COLO4_35646 [Corchorus olitorius]